ncbi:hypothetical protein H6G33_31360 [Calothrix sp. FACHB-1219]|uniref:hypothetical protein n=1 Tax=unclassified Calothrix TaxID=2619626 RepID=UPI001686175F|nr:MULTISPECIES: hypothetical protein [unclassified Calothrix]MBD2206972.1 hypothetical protein [Calothrix sp. FACHB-168]MBD2221470.1 hypothetical protein [Calothrix sp. FACHB-1219]
MRNKKVVNFISGHLDITQAEFEMHYRPLIDRAIAQNECFVVGDAPGADTLAQQYLWGRTEAVIVYHMFTSPRNNPGFSTRGGFQSDLERDTQMTLDSDRDIAWVRPGREQSGTQANCDRRSLLIV